MKQLNIYNLTLSVDGYSRSGKNGCGALRYYHDQIVKGHAFVEPERMLTDAEKIAALVEVLRRAREAIADVHRETAASGHGLRFPETIRTIDAALRAAGEEV